MVRVYHRVCEGLRDLPALPTSYTMLRNNIIHYVGNVEEKRPNLSGRRRGTLEGDLLKFVVEAEIDSRGEDNNVEGVDFF